MADDIGEMKQALTSIADSLRNLSAIEQRQLHLNDTTTRAHSRLDEIERHTKDEFKGHEKRIQGIEIQIAKNQWIERVVVVIVVGAITYWMNASVG